MIDPKPEDIGRKVTLPVFGAKPLTGTLVSIHTVVMVHYGDAKFEVATDPAKLEWAPEPAGCPSFDDRGSGGTQPSLDL